MSVPSFDSSSGSPNIGVGLILSTAWDSFRRRFGLHAGFGALWFVGIFGLVCVTACCLMAPMAVVIGASGASGASGSPAPGAAMVGMLVVVYGVMFVAMIAAMALHQNVTYAFTGADLSGQAMTLRDAARRGFDRILPQSLLSIVRMLADSLVLAAFVAVPFGILVATSGDSAPSDAAAVFRTLGPKVAILGVAYLFGGVAVIGMRAFTGLGPALVVAESLGPIDALYRSASLLSGHRLAFIGAKFCVWLGFVVVYLLMVGLMFATMGLSMDASNPPENPVGALLMMPVMLAIYVLMLLVYAFDHVCEAALYSRLVRPVYGAENVAGVFR